MCGETIRIPAAIPFLVVMLHNAHDRTGEVHRLQNTCADFSVLLDECELIIGESPWLVQDVFRNTQLADIV